MNNFNQIVSVINFVFLIRFFDGQKLECFKLFGEKMRIPYIEEHNLYRYWN